ncbi:MAG: hypothetical protein COX62_02300 [Deltaproteobacteria bacterium CG_4_10_14_0_2_um_filter_43_8]|nr:MAG: hypothetical protein COV43_00175 [Deltaproteobacteria bacterium CG11_big_fil_rev_8_21_14_0_20_42_23]PJA21526.1 MAG: hypothetical protein COX62_02300 [Deltaproteobacteria bacterium CG_4_10_14_0_2_um_filter_43_8]PJC64272.1 MAG: hypothetical protein CO021_04515 [Deltaproteobacteria bacterium CG_4_9_14_0_2_um_filter_42_21]
MSLSSIDFRQKPTVREVVGFGVLLCIILFSFYDSLLAPQNKIIDDVKKELTKVEKEKKEVSQLIQALDKKISSQQREKKDQQEQEAINNDRLEKVLKYKAEDVAQETTNTIAYLSDKKILKNLIFKGAEVKPSVEEKGYILIPLHIQLEGHYASLMRYMKQLEQVEKPLLIRDLKLVSNSDDGSELLARYNIELYLPK